MVLSKLVKAGTPPVKDRRLILGLGELVVNVLIGNSFRVITVCHPAHPVTVHFPVRKVCWAVDGGLFPFVNRLRNPFFSGFSCGLSCLFSVRQSALPPFRLTVHRNFPFCRDAPGVKKPGAESFQYLSSGSPSRSYMANRKNGSISPIIRTWRHCCQCVPG